MGHCVVRRDVGGVFDAGGGGSRDGEVGGWLRAGGVTCGIIGQHAVRAFRVGRERGRHHF